HTARISPRYLRQWPRLFYSPSAGGAGQAARLLGRDQLRRVLVIPGPASGMSRRHDYASERQVEILEFLGPALPDRAHAVRRGAGSESEHLVQLMKVYATVAPDEGHERLLF
ncbi:MAG: hypothetical protein LC672_01495, partial [Acidobacteria bacterium]|nr:hypothetical protein [Acidobacteriota bacterium]